MKSLGLVEIALDAPPPRRNIYILLDIVSFDVPALLGLNVLDSEKLYADNVTNRLVHRDVTSSTGEHLRYMDKWSVPQTSHDGHLYARMSFLTKTFYALLQLARFHR